MDEIMEKFATHSLVEETTQFDMPSMEEYTLDKTLDEGNSPNKYKRGHFSKFLGFPSIIVKETYL